MTRGGGESGSGRRHGGLPNELLVIATAKPAYRSATPCSTWDKHGIHKLAVTVVGMKQAERIATDLPFLGPNMNVEVFRHPGGGGGEVADEEAASNLTSLLDAATTRSQVVGMTLRRKAPPAAARTGEAPAASWGLLTVTAWGDDVLVVAGEVANEAEAMRARQPSRRWPVTCGSWIRSPSGAVTWPRRRRRRRFSGSWAMSSPWFNCRAT